jgi:hypothetical protein
MPAAKAPTKLAIQKNDTDMSHLRASLKPGRTGQETNLKVSIFSFEARD